MAALADNVIYLKFDSTTIQAYFVDVSLNPSNAPVDVTMGSGTAHIQRAPGLNDTKLSAKIGYDAAALQTYVQKLKPGNRVTVEYGPEGNVAGKPRHVQDFILSSVTTTENVTKTFVVFDISADGADAPAFDMYAGSVYEVIPEELHMIEGLIVDLARITHGESKRAAILAMKAQRAQRDLDEVALDAALCALDGINGKVVVAVPEGWLPDGVTVGSEGWLDALSQDHYRALVEAINPNLEAEGLSAKRSG